MLAWKFHQSSWNPREDRREIAMENFFETIVDLKQIRKTCCTCGYHQDQRIPKEAFFKLQAPIGLDIGGETPEEIAISIAAEMIAAKKEELETLKKKGVMQNVTE